MLGKIWRRLLQQLSANKKAIAPVTKAIARFSTKTEFDKII
jgi:hypothetical protein